MRFSVFSAALVLFVAGHAQAQSTPPAPPSADRAVPDPSTSRAPGEGEAAAHGHFVRALVWYRAGKYRLAAEELDAALEQDPAGKDLVFNLALVQEKLGDLDGAIRSLQRFQTMEKDPVEIERASQSVQRLEGARLEQLALKRPPLAAPTPSPPAAPTPRVRGKFDAWVAGSGGLALASLLVGAVFAVRALTLAPPDGAVAADLRSRGQQAHTAAVVSDISLATSVLAGAGSAALYFGRYRDVAPEHATPVLRLPQAAAIWLLLRY